MKSINKLNEHKVKIYSTTQCTYCNSLKHYLDKKGVIFEEAIVDHNIDDLREMLEESNGFAGVPFTVIEKDGCAKIKVKGFDVRQINAALDIN